MVSWFWKLYFIRLFKWTAAIISGIVVLLGSVKVYDIALGHLDGDVDALNGLMAAGFVIVGYLWCAYKFTKEEQLDEIIRGRRK